MTATQVTEEPNKVVTRKTKQFSLNPTLPLGINIRQVHFKYWKKINVRPHRQIFNINDSEDSHQTEAILLTLLIKAKEKKKKTNQSSKNCVI